MKTVGKNRLFPENSSTLHHQESTLRQYERDITEQATSLIPFTSLEAS